MDPNDLVGAYNEDDQENPAHPPVAETNGASEVGGP